MKKAIYSFYKTLLTLCLSTFSTLGWGQTTDLLFSEYGEGSTGDSKYIEIYNGTGASINLSNYRLRTGANGAGLSVVISMTGTLANGATWVIGNNSSDVPGANQYSGNASWNGDDAIALEKNISGTFVTIDVFGVIGNDPGTGWNIAGISNATVNRRIIRKPTVCSPITPWVPGTDSTNGQWIVGPAYTSGSANAGHTNDCTATCIAPTTQPNAFTSASITTNTATVGWTGNGDNVLVVARSGSAVNASPVNGTPYTANASFSSGSQIGTGNYVVYSGTGNSVNLTGLSPSTNYYFALYKFNTLDNCYNLVTPLTGDFSTLSPSTSVSVASLTGFSYVLGNGPSPAQSFEIAGANLSSAITVAAPANYQVSLTAGSGYQNSLTLTPSSGTLSSTTIYVRLTGGLAVSNYNGNVTVSTTGIADKTVAVAGSVTCGAVTSFPFTETFETSSTSRACWTQIQETGTGNWTYAAGSSAGNITASYAGSLNARFVSTSPSGGGVTNPATPITKLVSPVLDVTSLTNPKLTFWYGQELWSPDQNSLKVYYRTSSTGQWIELQHYTGNISTWTEASIDLPNPSATYQLAFEGLNRYGRANVLDNVTVASSLPCVVPPSQPTALSFSSSTQNSISGSFTGTASDKYLVVVSTSATLSANPVNGTAYTAGQTLGGGTVVSSSASTIFTANGLTASTPYYFFVFAYNDLACAGGPTYKSSSPLVGNETTLVGVWEDFEIGSNDNSYATSTPTFRAGEWTFVEGLALNNDSNDKKNGIRSARIRSNAGTNGYIQTNFNITTGLGNITVNHANFGDDVGGKWQLKISTDNGANWNNVGSEISSTAILTPTIITVNQPGNVRIRIEKTAGTRINIDDISITPFSGTPEPNINVQGNGITVADGDATPSLADGTDFGAAIIAGTSVERTFTIQNTGSSALTLDDPAVVLLDGSKGFTVSVQPAINPMNGFASQTFKINFGSAVPGTYTETVMIGSNDPDTPVYSFDMKATVAAPVVSANPTSLSGMSYAFGQGPSSPLQNFVVNGSNLAGDITATASANWEISTNQTYDGGNSNPWNSITINKTLGNSVNNRTIYVRLKQGLPVGSYTGTVTLSSPSAANVTVNLSGSVTTGIADIKVTGNGTNIPKNSTSPTGLNNTLFASQNIGNSQTKTFEIANVGGSPLIIGTIGITGADGSSFTIVSGPASGAVLNQGESTSFDIRFAPSGIGTKTATVTINTNDPNDGSYPFMIEGGATYCSSPGKLDVTQQGFESTPSDIDWSYTPVNIGAISPGTKSGFSTGKSASGDLPSNNNLFSEGVRGYRIQGNDTVASQITSGVQLTFADVDVTSYDGIYLTLKVAGFSLGSSNNGIDCNSDSSGNSCVSDEEKADFVLVEISPDGGTTWYQQAKVVSDQMNLPWSFGSTGTGEGSRAYAANNSLTYFKSTSGLKYSAITISNLPATDRLKVRITAQNNAPDESWIIDDVKITSSGLVPKVWNGTSWSPSPPQPSDKAIINADYNTGTEGSFAVCQCEIKSTATVTIGEDTFVQVTDFVKNDGVILVKPNGNFIQLVDTDSNTGSGTLKAIQNITVGNHQQYNYLISPTEGTNMKGVYRNADGYPIVVPIVMYHDEKNNRFFNSSGAYIKGRGLAVKEPTNETSVRAEFSGKPVNGAFSYGLVNSNPANSSRGFNLIGNPYPSNLDLIKFYQDNAAGGNFSPTFYFWDNNANTRTTQEGDGYGGQAYATFNAATPTGVGTATQATGDSGTSVLKLPTRYVKVAQGFMAKLENTATQNIIFSNSMRKADAAEGFFGKNDYLKEEVDRYWLKLISSSHLASNIAVVYFEEGDDGFTREDSRSMGGSDAVFSIVNGQKVSINGKSSFVNTDQVPLGTTHYANGIYVLALDKAEGVFANGQNIYLKDRLTGIITNLSEGNYTFTADAGEYTDRFEIVYKEGAVLVTDGFTSSGFIIYRDGPDFVAQSRGQVILNAEVYDAAGRLVVTFTGNRSDRLRINTQKFDEGMYVVKAHLQGGNVVTKKIRK